MTRLAGLLLAVAYLVGLLAGGALPAGTLLGLGLVLAFGVEGVRRAGLADHHALVLAWAPLHLLLLATGTLDSPGLPLAAAWVVALGLAWPRSSLPAAFAAAGLLLLGAVISQGTTPPVGAALGAVLLLALAAAAPHFLARPSGAAAEPTSGAADPDTAASRRAAAARHAWDAAAHDALDVVRRAALADDAVLWHCDRRSDTLHPLGWVGPADWDAPEPLHAVGDHPFGWTLARRQPMHLERGKNLLPRDRAAEMLLLPLDRDAGLLTLAYAAQAPDAAQTGAVAGARALASLVRLRPLPPAGGTTPVPHTLSGLPPP